MLNQFESTYELKRGIYLWILPLILIAIITNSITSTKTLTDLIINNTLTIWFIISWILIYSNRFIRFAELSNLGIISLYHVITVYYIVNNVLVKTGQGSLGDFIIWTPLYIMFIFLNLGRKRGFLFSIGIFVITLIMGIIHITKLSVESLDSINQFYFANIVYILVLYYAQPMFKAYTEVEILKEQAFVDSLTKVGNRHQIDEWIEEKLTIATERQEYFSIIFFDIDHFKKINDTYGHKRGDSVLKELASLIKQNLPSDSHLGRWGGEEFIVITNSSGQEAMGFAE
ncbi:MAG TPA: GGDEF domain-containing protein, partial [Pseudoneobacillus sp.]|nr:GGDEF domain-containing protein [Pseudoneobacillus sp.]